MNADTDRIRNMLFACTAIAFAGFLTCHRALAEGEIRGIKIVATEGGSADFVEIPLYSKTHAVIIGIDRYPNLPADRQLSYAVSDAQAVERVLRSKFLFNEILTLYNEEATRNNIMDVLLNKLAGVSKDDAVFVFYAGHGGQENTDFGQIGFLVPYDGSFKDMRSVVSMTTIRDDISKRIKAKHVFFVMDACYSGILVTTRSAAEKQNRRERAYLQQISKEPVRQVLTAGDANQPVLDGGPEGHSVFTGRFLEILDSADDFITASEVSAQVKERVFSDARARGHVQTPKSGEFFGLGDFIFMPSLTKKLGSLKDQVAELDRELAALREAEAKASAAKDEAARRESERQRRVTEAKLQAKKLEEERLRQEETERARRENERQASQENAKQQKASEEQRLASLRREVEEKRKVYKSSMVTSLADALHELQTLENEIGRIRDRYREELKGQVLAIMKLHSESFGDVALNKDEFETEADYKKRIAVSAAGDGGSNKARFQQAVDVVRSEYEKQIAPLKARMEEISKVRYTVYGHDGLKMVLGKYDADRQRFTVTIASANVDRPVYPQQYFQIVQEVGGQASKAGVRMGDIILRYNGHDVTPTSDWSLLKQTVLGEWTTMEVDRDGRKYEITLGKGNIGTVNRLDDYLPDLPAGQFIVNGFLSVPSGDARLFKQNFLNNLVTAEVQVMAATPGLCLVISAFVVDETSGKRYDLFQSPYINMGNRITWDLENKIYWISKPLRELSYTGTERFLERLEYRGSTGWTLPTLSQIESIRNEETVWRYGLNEYLRTGTPGRNGHVYYDPRNGNKDDYTSDKDIRKFVSVSSQILLPSYHLLKDRFVDIGANMMFDSVKLVVWLLRRPEKEMTHLEAEAYVKQLNVVGFRGWRLPEIEELEAIRETDIPGIDKRYEEYFSVYLRTRTPGRNGHVYFNPKDGNKDDYTRDQDKQMFLAVM